MEKYHVHISAEAYAAAIFAQVDFDVSVQYGANQPEYDLVVIKNKYSIKVSVKGSQDGGWRLVNKATEQTYHEAIDSWKKSQKD